MYLLKEVIVITFNTVISKKLYVQIYEQILSGIQSGIFQVGDKLPSERELCIHFGVSRAPIRQALSALEMNGFISSRQGDGVFVKDTQATAIKNVLEIVAESVSPEDILEARLVIEPLIIKFAALRATDEELENLNKIVRKMEIETKQGIYAPETDEELHHSIAKASHNELFIAFMASIGKAMQQQKIWTFLRDRSVTHPDYRETNFNEHKRIIEAVVSRNEKEAVKKMTLHMQKLQHRYWKE